MVIDTHHHFWHYTKEAFDWVGHDVLRRDFLAADFQPVLKAAGVDSVISVQARQSEDETRWLLELAETHRWIAGVVGWVPLIALDIADRLDRHLENSKLRGVRHVLQGESDLDYMLRDDFSRGIAALAQHELCYDVLILPKHLPNTIRLVDRHPDQIFVLDHLAKPLEGEVFQNWVDHLRQLATRCNVYCKLSGGCFEVDPAKATLEALHPYFDVALEAFGAQRIMFGSNWPLTEVAGGYSHWLAIVNQWADQLSPDERDQIFSGTATAAYRLELP